MENKNTSAVEILGKALAEMTVATIETERQLNDAKGRADEWYKHYLRKDEEYKELQTMLAAEIRGHEKTKAELEDFAKAVEELTAELEYQRAQSARNPTQTPEA